MPKSAPGPECVPTIACVDVHYCEDTAKAAAILFNGWQADRPISQWTVEITGIAPYEPGRFFRRELPCLTQLLSIIPVELDIVVIDGYVWLDDSQLPGLGARLYDAIGRVVVGVAKTRFQGAPGIEV